MGTRNLIAVISNEEVKVAQYGQWDGYPIGQGMKIYQNLKDKDLDLFKENVNKCSWITEEQRKQCWLDIITDEEDKKKYLETGSVNYKYVDKFNLKYGQLSRDTGANVLGMIYLNNGLTLLNDYEFGKDSLYCEWAYIIDLDKNILEIYQGFNKAKLKETERFYTEESDRMGYYGCKLLATFNLTYFLQLNREETIKLMESLTLGDKDED